jgi:2-hydroxy-4-carboxymuconate semialdehyde hemiacetal dehydrogenase
MKHRICLLGYGAIAGFHAQALTAAGAEVACVVGPKPGRRAEFAARWGAAAHTDDLDSALADNSTDIVLVASPTDLHADQTGRALRAGKHVLAEIPVATSYSEYSALAAEAEARDLRLAVCHTHRYYPGQGHIHSLVEAGALHVRQIAYRHHMFRRDTVGWTGYVRSWADNLLWHHGGHVVDSCLWMLGAREVEVVAVGAQPSGPLDIVMDLAFVLRTPADQIVSVSMSYNDHLRSNDLIIIGDETSFRISGEDGVHKLAGPEGTLIQTELGKDNLADSVARQDAGFLTAVDRHEDAPISAAAIEPTMRTLQAIQDALGRAGASSAGATVMA